MTPSFRMPVWPLLLALLLAGCSNATYYAQAINGHFAVMRAAVPIDELIGDPASDALLKRQLADVQAIREFASRELALPDNGSYRSYADLGRPYAVWNVFAAPELSLDGKRWCLLMVGCVNYRGYYQRQDAERLAAQLRQEGYDTFVGGVPAYSTLGYFDDPVLNTFLRLGTQEVARTVFHELAHQLLFVEGDTVFNESFATAVEREGMRRWLASHATAETRAAFATQQARKAAVMALMRDYRRKFAALYASDLSASEQRHGKAELFAALRRDYADLKTSWGGYSGYDPFFADDLNNAKLVSLALYSEWLPAFERLLDDEQHDLPRFYQRVARLAALDSDARRELLQRTVAATGESTQAAIIAGPQPTAGALRVAASACGGCP